MSSSQLDDLARLATLDDPVRRRLYEYVSGQIRPVGRDEAAAAVGIGRTLAAYHLDKLAAAGLLETSYERPAGRGGPGAGRPAKLYSRSERELAVAVPPRDYLLAGRLLAEAAERDAGGATRRALREAARALGTEAGADGRTRKAKRRALEDVLRGRGYEPFEDEEGVLRLRNCPFHELAQRHQELVCAMNVALVEGLVAGLGADSLQASFEPGAGRCCVAIRPPSRPAVELADVAVAEAPGASEGPSQT